MENMENNANQPEPKSNFSWVAGIIVVAIIAGGFFYFKSQPKIEQGNEAENQAQTTGDSQNSGDNINPGQVSGAEVSGENQNPSPTPTATPTASAQSSVKTFTVEGSNYKFLPSEIKVKKGDTVKIVFNNSGGFHDFVIDEFNVKTAQIGEGKSETIEFVADKAGTFEYYCSVGQHRAMGMKGKLIVE